MATPPSDDSRTLFRLLADGQWHPYVEVRDALARTVPPGRAIRRYEDRLAYSRESLTGRNGPQRHLSEDEKIELGQRACAQRIITSWKGRGVQAIDEGGQRKIRLKPGFQTWGWETPVSADSEQKEPEGSQVSQSPGEAPDGELSRAHEASGVRGDSRAGPVAEAGMVPPEKAASQDPYADLARYTPDAQDSVRYSPSVATGELPECPECGLGVINQARHDEWHARMRQQSERSEMALLDENAMRTLLGDVMGLVLDRFQDGMVEFLEERFADVDAKFLQVVEALMVQRRSTARWVPRGPGQPGSW